MGTTWDKGTYKITNNAGDDLTLNDASLGSGKWGDYPVTTVSNGASGQQAFVAQSKDDALVGPDGTVKYGLPNGTVMIIRFSVPYGTSSVYCHATLDGPRASRYETKVHQDDYHRSNGGAGKRTTYTVTLDTK